MDFIEIRMALKIIYHYGRISYLLWKVRSFKENNSLEEFRYHSGRKIIFLHRNWSIM